MPRKTLHVVGDSETPAAPRDPLTVTQAAASGSRRELLVALRDRVAKAVESEGTPPRDLAALSKRLTDITREIAFDAQEQRQEGGVANVSDARFDASAV